MGSYKKPESTFSKGFLGSVNAALEGVVHTLISERNMRVHFIFGFIVLIVGIYVNLDAIEFMLLCFAVTIVLVAEMFNTAVEHGIDLVKDEYHPLAKVIKDIAAGAVFVAVVNAAIVGYILLAKRIRWDLSVAFFKIKQSPWHMTFIALLVVIGLVLLIKVLRREKSLLKGGMPSGHSAMAFAIWTAVSLLTENALVCILVFFLAVIIAKSRLLGGVHTLLEIISGSVLGALTTLIIFQLLL